MNNIFRINNNDDIEHIIKLFDSSFMNSVDLTKRDPDPDLSFNKIYYINSNISIQILRYKKLINNSPYLLGAFYYKEKFVELNYILDFMNNEDKKIFLFNLDLFR